MSEGAGGGGRREAEGGYRTKNKNPTRQCGEQSEGGSHIVPRLPRKNVAASQRRLGTKRAIRASPVP